MRLYTAGGSYTVVIFKNSNKKMYYFETNTLRSLGAKLVKFQFKTSHLCLVELLTGMKNEKEFSIRQKSLARIKESNCPIDTMLPEYKLFTAFGFDVKQLNDQIFNSTQELIELVLSLNEFDPHFEHAHLNVLLQYDQNSNFGWRNAIEERTQIRRQAYSSKNNSQEFRSRWGDKVYKTDYLVDYINFYSGILKRQDITKDCRDVQQIAANYDGSLNRYLISMGFYVDDKVLNNSLTKMNEYPDINHLMYVNGNEIIATNDKFIHKLHEVTGDNQLVKKIEELREK